MWTRFLHSMFVWNSMMLHETKSIGGWPQSWPLAFPGNSRAWIVLPAAVPIPGQAVHRLKADVGRWRLASPSSCADMRSLNALLPSICSAELRPVTLEIAVRRRHHRAVIQHSDQGS